MTDEDARPTAGSVEEEARRLIEAAQGWWASGASPRPSPDQNHARAACPGCLWCRLTAGRAPEWAPDAADGLADVLGMAATALHAFAADHRPEQDEEPPTRTPTPEPGSTDQRDGTEPERDT